MIRTNRPIAEMSDQDIIDTLAYYKKQLGEWQVFQKQVIYFQSFAVAHAKDLSEKIEHLKNALKSRQKL